VQLEEACVLLLQNLHGVDEDGAAPVFTVQVMLHSSERFGPANVRELTVRAPSRSAAHAIACSEPLESVSQPWRLAASELYRTQRIVEATDPERSRASSAEHARHSVSCSPPTSRSSSCLAP
jgi:hypothetical protein